MIEVAVFGWGVYVLVAFVLRTALHTWQTGSSGFVAVRAGASWPEKAAAVAMVAAFVLGLIGPFVGTPIAETTWLGAALVGLATLATLVAQLAMAKSWRIGVNPEERTELVTRFPFTVVRNPIFTCMIAASTGVALACPTPLALVAPLVLTAALSVQVRLVEEPYLLSAHGAAYRAYAARTGRFLPFIGLGARAA